MSLAIEAAKVVGVLLADGWHNVADYSFTIDSYEYLEYHPNPDRDPFVLLGGGREPLIPAAGFGFTDSTGVVLCGPLTSLLAVRVEK